MAAAFRSSETASAAVHFFKSSLAPFEERLLFTAQQLSANEVCKKGNHLSRLSLLPCSQTSFLHRSTGCPSIDQLNTILQNGQSWSNWIDNMSKIGQLG